MIKVNHLEDIVINDSSKFKVKIIFDIRSAFGGRERHEATGFLTKDKSLFKFIQEISYNMTCPINVTECFVENSNI